MKKYFGRGLLSLLALIVAQIGHAATVLITGANSGIGLEFAKQYAAAGWTVIATHRHDTTPDTLAALVEKYKNVRPERMDVTSVDEVHALSEKLKDVPIDVLINNAAVTSGAQQFGQLDYEVGKAMMTTNVLGPLLVSESFVRQIGASQQKKIVSITSTHASLTEPIAGSGAVFYRASKAALNREMLVVADVLKPQGISVFLIHPGSVQKTEYATPSIYAHRVTLPVSVGSIIKTIDTMTLKDTGRFVLFDGTTLPW